MRTTGSINGQSLQVFAKLKKMFKFSCTGCSEVVEMSTIERRHIVGLLKKGRGWFKMYTSDKCQLCFADCNLTAVVPHTQRADTDTVTTLIILLHGMHGS